MNARLITETVAPVSTKAMDETPSINTDTLFLNIQMVGGISVDIEDCPATSPPTAALASFPEVATGIDAAERAIGLHEERVVVSSCDRMLENGSAAAPGAGEASFLNMCARANMFRPEERGTA